MARPKQFERDDVLEKAMQLFWSKGYERTSMQDLVEAMGINRGSLYDTFGDKDALYQLALARYCETESARVLTEIGTETASPKSAIRRYFDWIIDTAMNGNERGCFISNTVAEFGLANNAIAATAQKGVVRTESAFRLLVEQARHTGEISRRNDPAALARYLTSSLNGLRLMARSTTDRDVLEDVVAVTMSALD